jgi:arabinan endo-1,5-alpha-L-arabinosidase
MRRGFAFALPALLACSSSLGAGGSPGVIDAAAEGDGGTGGAGETPTPTDAATAPDEGVLPSSADAGAPCSTRITYGAAWIHPQGHAAQDDVVPASVNWDGTCVDDGPNSYALLSNGYKPYFQGNGACILALDYAGTCASVPSACTTRVTYGSAWLPPPNHAAAYDDVTGRIFSDGACLAAGVDSYANLSNGWQPHFKGASSCRLSFEYTQCGGLYTNPVIPADCPDPGVLHDGSSYVLTCTSGDAPDAYPIYTSPDLVTWTPAGHVFPSGQRPSWARRDFWAPEIHHVGAQYVVYFSARGADGMLAIGAASAPAATGPFTDIGQPLVHDASVGLIDASEINASDGTSYVLWKEDGNAIGHPTPIHAQALAGDGLSLAGSAATLITNDQPWEGAVTEAPFMVEHGDAYFLFYSGNAYYNGTYAVGVASSSSPLGPFTKANGPILVTDAAWVGPGHCSVVDTGAGDTYMVFHAWQAGCVNAAGCGRLVLTDAVTWGASWPSVPLAPSSTTRPLP